MNRDYWLIGEGTFHFLKSSAKSVDLDIDPDSRRFQLRGG